MTEHEEQLLTALPGWCSPRKMHDLYRLVYDLSTDRAVLGVEIGVLGGRSLFPVALALRDREVAGGPSGHVVGIDPYGLEYFLDGDGAMPPHETPWPGVSDLHVVREMATIMAKRIGLDWVSLLLAPSQRVARLFPKIDYLHIDGNHCTDRALADTQTWLPKLNPGGLVVFDDTDFGSVQPARDLIIGTCGNSVLRVHRHEEQGDWQRRNDYEVWRW